MIKQKPFAKEKLLIGLTTLAMFVQPVTTVVAQAASMTFEAESMTMDGNEQIVTDNAASNQAAVEFLKNGTLTAQVGGGITGISLWVKGSDMCPDYYPAYTVKIDGQNYTSGNAYSTSWNKVEFGKAALAVAMHTLTVSFANGGGGTSFGCDHHLWVDKIEVDGATSVPTNLPSPPGTPSTPTPSIQPTEPQPSSGSNPPPAPTPQPTVKPTPIAYEVPDCPGVKRMIDASHLPPDIYPKVGSCGVTGSSSTAGSGPTGVCQYDPKTANTQYGTGLGAPPAGAIFWTITGGQTYGINQGLGDTVFSHSDYGQSSYGYGAAYGVTGHAGVDVGTPEGTKLYTPVAGKVELAGGTEYYTYYGTPNVPQQGELKIDLANGDALILGHMLRIDVHVGDVLTAGQYVGLSGGENGPHVHVEYRMYDPTWDGSEEHQLVMDPRVVFGCSSSTTSTTGSTTGTATNGGSTPGGGTSTPGTGPQVEAAVAPASSMAQFQSKYGFFAPSGKTDIDFSKYSQAFATERDLAVKYAPTFDLEPELVVWWTYAETAPPYDSYTYSNCLNQQPYPIDQECPSISSGNWQIGYGQQYYESVNGVGLTKAFQDTHGDPNNAQLVQQVCQAVLTAAKVTGKQCPALTTEQMLQNEGANRYWIFTLSRDQAMSVYLTASEIHSDLGGATGGRTYKDVVEGWGPYYTDTIWQQYSNILNDVLVNWGIASSGTIGGTCTNTLPTGGTCGTVPDSFNSMDLQTFIDRVNEAMPTLKQGAACAHVPWMALAAILHMEVGEQLDVDNPWQFDPKLEHPERNTEPDATCSAAKLLQEKATDGPVGKPLTDTMDPSDPNNATSLKDAFYGYNGRADFTALNVPKGCTAAPQADMNWDCSGYVMNNFDTNHENMCYSNTTDQGSAVPPGCYTYDGAWTIYYKLYYSTYDSSGKLLVFGGQCSMQNQVVGGIALPTKTNLQITGQFFSSNVLGININNTTGDAVFALADGDIAASGWSTTGGYYVLEHIPANGTAGNTSDRWAYYGGLDSDGLPPKGSQVKAGQQIGKTGPHMVQDPSGKTVPNGTQPNPQLHFDIRTRTDETTNPQDHVNPCSIDLFKTGYPSLDCSGYPGKGVAWK